jgi:UDP-glucose 4-epimerase
MVSSGLVAQPAPESIGSMTVLVTGGAGYIGSHVCVELIERGHEVVVVDNYANCSPVAVDRIQMVTGRRLAGVHRVDLRDRRGLAEVFRRSGIDAVIHLAGKKAVGESTRIPLDYYDNNLGGTASLLRTMGEHGVWRLVFSSSCSIYGETAAQPIGEDAPHRPTNPYASTKAMCEQIFADACQLHPEMSVISLRYFNPTGAHASGLLGECPKGVPYNIMPYLALVAAGRRECVLVYGHDYPTPDGTAVRDYVHVLDIAEAHRMALERLDLGRGTRAFNLGTGSGTSVLELLTTFGAVSDRPVPYELVERRPGDVARLVADPTAVMAEWGWRAQRDLATMCEDAWRFQQVNPDGYDGGRCTAPTAPVIGPPK